ncbi:MarR family winged helix-turn-helix transcriptional regulator [Lentibacillus cibarius]|uniref:MarR family transcriptional regulator n=1 Tax=Lentibacillus cibarius TaxID=2583219 RepID=A0A5S3QIP3_9BACI|nr:MarR family transcriptional regulator [Lentibacillus cibarius]TMN21599.1 MarR family transcriptional regulator [Lentibacillus cibarius]
MRHNDDVMADIVLDIVRLANLLERLGGQYAKNGGLSSVYQYMLLAMLSFHESLSMRELRENTLVTKQAITGLVERMKKTGHIDTYTDPNDRRVTRVYITALGKQTLEDIRPYRKAGNREAFSVLNEEEMTQLATILPKLIDHLK